MITTEIICMFPKYQSLCGHQSLLDMNNSSFRVYKMLNKVLGTVMQYS